MKQYLLIVVLGIFSAINAYSQSSNDACTSAITLTVGSSCTSGSIVTANSNTGEPAGACFTYPNDDGVWYVFKATATSTTVNVFANGGAYSPSVAVYNGGAAASPSCPASTATAVGCANYSTNESATISLTGLTVNSWYYILVDMPSTIAQSFCVSVNNAPANDNPCGAISLTVGGACQETSLMGATATAGPANPSCWLTTPSTDTWYSFVATDDSMTISTDYMGNSVGDLIDSQIALYSGTCSGTLTQVSCDENSGGNVGNNSIMSATTLTVGATYYVRVDGYSTNVGDFCITAFETPPTEIGPGQTCADAMQAYPSTTCSASQGSLAYNYIGTAGFNGTTEGLDGACNGNDAVQEPNWVVFTANATTTTLTNQTAGANQETHDYAVYSGACGTLTPVTCATVTDGASTSIATTIGTKYYVMVTASGTTATAIRTDVCLTSSTACSTPSNNNCSSASSISVNTTYTATNACATADGALCSGSMENNIWYTWTAPATWTAGQNAFLNVWNENCTYGTSSGGVQVSMWGAGTTCATAGSTNCMIYVDQNNDNEIHVGFEPTAGSTYLFTFDGEGGQACTFNFSISSTFITPLPVELLNFQAQLKDRNVNLTWETASELNNDYFEVERSQDGLRFEKVGRIKGQGTTKANHAYALLDRNTFEGVSYYRLKQVDFNGESTYSSVITVEMPRMVETISVIPNPANNSAYFLFTAPENEVVYLQIYESGGKRVKASSHSVGAGENNMNIDLSDIPNGVYYVLMTSQAKLYKAKLIIKKD